jgi:hypothetical protein
MKRLPSLDLLADGPQRRVGWWLFSVGVTACVISGALALHRADSATLSQLPGLAWLRGAAAPTVTARWTGFTAATAPAGIDRPAGTGDAWRLLLALDDAASDRPVHLLSLQPTPDGQHLRARVRAADLPAMRSWLLALTAQRPFEGAVLLRHEWVGDPAGQAPTLHFEVEVDWPARTAALPDAVKPRACG